MPGELGPTSGSALQTANTNAPSCESGCGGCGGCGSKVSKESIFDISFDLTVTPDALDTESKTFLDTNKEILTAIPDGTHANLKIGDRIFTGNKKGDHFEGFMSKAFDESVVNIDASSYISSNHSKALIITNKLPDQPAAHHVPEHIKRLREQKIQNTSANSTQQTMEKTIEPLKAKKQTSDAYKQETIPPASNHHEERVKTLKDTLLSTHVSSEIPSVKAQVVPKSKPREIVVEEKIAYKVDTPRPIQAAPKSEPIHHNSQNSDPPSAPLLEVMSLDSAKTEVPADETSNVFTRSQVDMRELIQTHSEAKKALFTFIATISEALSDQSQSNHAESVQSLHHDVRQTELIQRSGNQRETTAEKYNKKEIVILLIPDQHINIIRQFLIAAQAKPTDVSGVFHIDASLEDTSHDHTQTFIFEENGHIWTIQLIAEHNKPMKIVAPRQALEIIQKRLSMHAKHVPLIANTTMMTAEEENQGNLVSLSLGYTDDTLLFWFSYLQLKATLPFDIQEEEIAILI